MKLFTTEQVSKWHPDKYADQISDAILTMIYKRDKEAHVAVETMVKGNTIVLAGEVESVAHFNKDDFKARARTVGRKLGYATDEIVYMIGEQSREISRAVKRGGELKAGDQGMMFGYAVGNTKSMLPFGFEFANALIHKLENDIETNRKSIFVGDAKCAVTVDLQKKDSASLNTILVSACHRFDSDIKEVRKEAERLISELLEEYKIMYEPRLIINPAGKWVQGGPTTDCGLTGRKIVCDSYGGYVPAGGGAFSGKDPSKVDRSGAYMARKMAREATRRFELDYCEVQLAYAIGRAEPISIGVRCSARDLEAEIEKWMRNEYNMTPNGIIESLDLRHVDFEKVSEGCHFRPESGLKC